MNKQQTTINLLIALLLILNLAACGGGNIPATPPVQSTPTSEVVEATQPPPTPTESPTPAASPTPLPDPPAGWVEYVSADLGISLHHPADWEVEFVAGEVPKLDLRAPVGEGWLEILAVDAANAHRFSATEEMLADPQLMAQTYRAAAETDASFSEAQPLETRTGAAAWNYEGINDIYEDRVWAGFMALPPRAIIGLGHAQQDTPQWESELVPLYQQIMWSVLPLQPNEN